MLMLIKNVNKQENFLIQMVKNERYVCFDELDFQKSSMT